MATSHLSGPLLFNDTTARLVPITASTLTVTQADHSTRVVALNNAAGVAVTLPAASGSGDCYRFVLTASVTSNSTTFKVANSSDVMAGIAVITSTSGNTAGTTSTSDTITFNGSTTGGLIGSYVQLTDVAANLWHVTVLGVGSGTVASPFSATV